MTPEHHGLLMMLGAAGRLGPFCPNPLPHGYTGDPTIIPKTTSHGREVDLPELGPRPVLADPAFVARNWRLLGERIERMTAMLPPCPHCGSVDVSRGATGLDQCRQCDGLSRDGQTLMGYHRENEPVGADGPPVRYIRDLG